MIKNLIISTVHRVSYSSVVVRNRGLEELARVQNRGLAEDQQQTGRGQKTKAT